MKVLVLEDNLERIEHFKKKFRIDDVVFVDDALHTIDELALNTFDLVCLDHDLGGMEIQYDMENCGTVVAEWIAKNPLKNNPRVIVHSLNTPLAENMVKLIPNARYIPFYWLS